MNGNDMQAFANGQTEHHVSCRRAALQDALSCLQLKIEPLRQLPRAPSPPLPPFRRPARNPRTSSGTNAERRLSHHGPSL